MPRFPRPRSIVHKVMLPPGVRGRVERVQPDGEYTVRDELAAIRTPDGKLISVAMLQEWPIRTPRPVCGQISGRSSACDGTAYFRHAVSDLQREARRRFPEASEREKP